jgi:hypothetical protein
MPVRDDLRWFYPIDWPLISERIRFGRAKGRCERCGRPHKRLLAQLPDGRWYDPELKSWRDDRGADAPWPDIVDYAGTRPKLSLLSTAHLDHDPQNSHPRNLAALCQRCHLTHDRAEHLRRRRLGWLRRRAIGDLFEGGYRFW